MTLTASRPRVRRCAWSTAPGEHCPIPATKRATVTYLGEPLDRHPAMCEDHASRAHELIAPPHPPGYAITAWEAIA